MELYAPFSVHKVPFSEIRSKFFDIFQYVKERGFFRYAVTFFGRNNCKEAPRSGT